MVSKAILEIEGNFNVINVDSSSKNKYGIKNIPGLVVNGQVVSEGKVLSIREIKRILV